jgi:hypothetical protein
MEKAKRKKAKNANQLATTLGEHLRERSSHCREHTRTNFAKKIAPKSTTSTLVGHFWTILTHLYSFHCHSRDTTANIAFVNLPFPGDAIAGLDSDLIGIYTSYY